MCHLDQRQFLNWEILNDIKSIRRFLRLMFLKTRDKVYNLRLAVAQSYVTCSLKFKLLSIVTPKRTSAQLDFRLKFSMFIALSTNGLKNW